MARKEDFTIEGDDHGRYVVRRASDGYGLGRTASMGEAEALVRTFISEAHLDAGLGAAVEADAKEVGNKFDGGKDRFELVPPEAIFGIVKVMTFGAAKYGDRNWERGLKWSRCFGALMRHLWCWWGGKGPTTRSFLFGDTDDETKLSHLWHAGCCLFFLIAYEERATGEDDRPPAS